MPRVAVSYSLFNYHHFVSSSVPVSDPPNAYQSQLATRLFLCQYSLTVKVNIKMTPFQDIGELRSFYAVADLTGGR